jgi:hypothetical protein
MLMKPILGVLIGTVGLAGCIDVGGEAGEELGVSESALCLLPSVPVAPSQSRTVPAHGARYIDAANYGTSECSRVTLEFKTTHTADAYVLGIDGISTQAACGGTRLLATFFYAEPTGSQNWVQDGSYATTGSWESGSCNDLVIPYNAPSTRVPLSVPPYHSYQTLPRDVRMVISAQRTLCTQLPSGLELCGTTYGLPVHAVGNFGGGG